MNIEKLLNTLVIIYQNEANFYLKSKQDYLDFLIMIVEIFRIKNGLRYHKKDKCSCQPEERIKVLLKNNRVMMLLEKEKLIEYVNLLLKKPINKNVTIYDKREG